MTTRISGTRNVTINNQAITANNNVSITVGNALPVTNINGNLNLNTPNTGAVAVNYVLQVGQTSDVILTNKAITIGTAAGNTTPADNISVLTVDTFSVGSNLIYKNGVLTLSGNISNFVNKSTKNVGSNVNPSGLTIPNPAYTFGGSVVQIDDGQYFSTIAERKLASSYFTGGVGIEQDLAVGGWIYGRIAQATSATQTLSLIVHDAADNREYYPTFVPIVNPTTATNTATFFFGDTGTNHLSYNPNYDNAGNSRLTVDNLAVAGTIYGDTNVTDQILNNIYTNYLGLPAKDTTLTVGAGILDVFGEVRVRGKTPLGTGPVVTNVLYVTLDGNDTNDGRAMDSSRACRTIGGAMKSPYYQPGTQIRVSPGLYYENNPLIMKPYTSVQGSDIRTTFIEPINKTQDLFHVNSGCYLQAMNFLNGRSGLLPGQYAIGYNRGAYATSFPPSINGEKINLFQSPYIQNCTNQNGPWLVDSTMFLPNQTVQVPSAVGRGSWNANTTSIVVSFDNIAVDGWINVGTVNSTSTDYTNSLYSSLTLRTDLAPSGTTSSDWLSTIDPMPALGDAITVNDTGDLWVYTAAPGIQIGQSINAGKQNRGFFNARTLLLANKPFLQSQIVAYIDAAFSSGSFYADPAKSSRDIGLIIDAVASDLLYNSVSDSTFAGLQYWQQDVGLVQTSQETLYTISATNYLSTVAQSYVSVGNQATVQNLFDTIVNIITNGTAGVSDIAVFGGLPSTNPQLLADYQALQNNKSAIQDAVINYIDGFLNYVPYNTSKCSRDTGLIVDALAQDLLFDGTSQSDFAGLQYWAQTGLTGNITAEKTQTIGAINYARSLSVDIVQNVTGNTARYPTLTSQNTNLPAATINEAAAISLDMAVVTNIINNGTSGVTDTIVPNGLVPGTGNVLNAYNLLQTNKTYIQEQTIAYISDAYPGFNYTTSTCYRDVGYIIDSVSFDLLYGGNRQAIQSGVYYYTFSTSVETISPTELAQTTAAYDYIKTLAQYIVKEQPIPSPYQTAVKQVITPLAGTDLEVSIIDSNIDRITAIINNGPNVSINGNSLVRTPIGLVPSSNFLVQNAAQALHANRAFIQAEVIAYINNFGAFYNKNFCRRDVGYMIDSVSYDLLHGVNPTTLLQGNIQSIKSGVYYYKYSTENTTLTTSTVLKNTIPQCTAAINFISSYLPDIISGTPIPSPLQLGVLQTLSTATGSAYQVTEAQQKLEYIIRIINEGPSVADPKTPQLLVENTASYVINSYNLLVENIPFIAAEVVAFFNNVASPVAKFSYNRQKCYRDVGILVENMAYDMAFGGNQKSIESGLAYFNGVTSVIPGQQTQCISGIYYLNDLCQKIVTNTTCTVLTVSPADNIPVGSQIINSNLTGGDVAIPAIENLFNITISYIENGPNTEVSSYTSTGPDAAYISAEVLLQANRKFIQENTLNYINWNLCYPPKTLPYNQITCARDVGIILDSIGIDLMFPTPTYSQSNFAGVQYYAQNGYLGQIPEEIDPTIDAVTYLRDLSIKVVQNITSSTDALVGIYRYTNGIQITTSTGAATNAEVSAISSEFFNILTILKGNTSGWTDQIVPNGITSSQLPSVQNTVDLLLKNTDYLAGEVLGYVGANYPGFVYTTSTCSRDVGFIIQSVSFDLLYGGNRQSIQTGLSYYASKSTAPIIPQEQQATVAAFNYLGTLVSSLVLNQTLSAFTATYTLQQTVVPPVLGLPVGSVADKTILLAAINTITNIISNGPSVAAVLRPVSLTEVQTPSTIAAYNIIEKNKSFITAEVVSWINQTYNAGSFDYNQELCYRDTGLLVDAVSQDILLGGNSQSIKAGLSYWNQAYNYVAGQVSTTTAAINYIAEISSQIIANNPVAVVTGTVATQVINPFYQYGTNYMPQQSVARCYNIISNIIENGPSAAPPEYVGGGLFALTGLNGSSVTIAPKVTSLQNISTGTYLIGLSTATIGFGINSTLYFGNTEIFPLQNSQVESYSLQYTGSYSTWNERKVDQQGGMGGSLVDGSVISDISPIQSFVYDAFTQLCQGGVGVHVTNNGYAQLVSVFTIFCDTAVLCDNGGIASITNSNCNFGNYGLIAKGYGTRSFSGTVYNPIYRSYPFSPGPAGLDQYYPQGYWPHAGTVQVFVPDLGNRPHIGLVMEVVPPDSIPTLNGTTLTYTPYINQQGFSGFLNAQPSTSTLTTGTIELTNIDITNVYIGNLVYIRDQYGHQYDENGVRYVATGTYVTDVNYNSITLSTSLTSGGGDVTNPTYFTVYFCGNSYYTVNTSVPANSPYKPGANILSANSDPNYQGPTVSQIAAHVAAVGRLKEITDQIITNVPVTVTPGNTKTQIIDNTVTGGSSAQTFIDLRFTQMINIINAPTLAAAQSVVPQNLITTLGTVPTGSGAAITLITENLDFMAAEIVAFVNQNFSGQYNSTTMSDFQAAKCVRDVTLIMQQIIYDLQTGGNYNSVYSGLSYWARPGTYHIVELGEPVTNPTLFPDGSTVNFYQRSYISASGYLFEYVGAGANYGALPQRGVADPVQKQETISLNSGKVFFTSTDQNGDFRIGTGLVISQATGVLSGRTFVQSLYAYMTPFILAIE
jgi:hypothetical protein